MYANNRALVNLGFTAEQLPQGAHICHIYSNQVERESTLVHFIASGLQANERVACLTEEPTRTLCESLNKGGLDSKSYESRSQLSFASSRDSYFDSDIFKPEPMLEVLQSFHQDAVREGQNGARIIVEMHPLVAQNLNQLMEHEARVSLLQEKCPVTMVCQYNAEHFDGATMMKLLKVHAFLLVHGAIIHNPFFMPAKEFLASKGYC